MSAVLFRRPISGSEICFTAAGTFRISASHPEFVSNKSAKPGDGDASAAKKADARGRLEARLVG
jgi:hypothetical protein